MYNIDLYSYWKEPYTRTRKFTIHPLDEPGLEKYFSSESHVVHYLDRTDPFVFKSTEYKNNTHGKIKIKKS